MTRLIHLDWTRLAFPDDFFCRTYSGGCGWALVPVFGGLALASPRASGIGYRWEWTSDGSRWQRLRGLPADVEWLQSDGTSTGAFAYTET